MATSSAQRPYGKTAVFGVLAVGLYAVLLTRQDLVNDVFTKGGAYALLPIATAFLFSYIHGAFTGHFWSSLGVEASKARKEVK